MAFLVYPLFVLLLLFFHLVSFPLNTVMLMNVSPAFFSLLQSEPMIFLALILAVPEPGSSGADTAPPGLQLPALPAELAHLQMLLVLQRPRLVDGFQVLRIFTGIVIDNFILFLTFLGGKSHNCKDDSSSPSHL